MESGSASSTPTATDGAATAGPARRLTGGRLLVVALGVVLLIQGLFVISYVGALHNPQPHNVPFGITGSPKLAAAVGTQFSLRTKTYADESAARRAIDQRSIYGALITNPSATTLLVAPAASNAVATALTTAFTTAAAATGRKLTVVQVHPLAGGDRAGIVPFLVAMALDIGGYLSATMVTTLGGTAAIRRRAPILAGTAVIGALVTYLIAGPLLGGIPSGHFLELWGIFAFLMLAVACGRRASEHVRAARDVDRDRRLRDLRRSGRRRISREAVPPRVLEHDRSISSPGRWDDSSSKHDLFRRQRDSAVASRSRGLSRCGGSRPGRDQSAVKLPTDRCRNRHRNGRRRGGSR